MDNQTATSQKWLTYSQNDLEWTEANLKEKIWYGACLTAQQASEKALKSYLISKGETTKKIHDLGAILESCINLDSSFSQLKNQCITLTDYYISTRYPDMGDFIDFNEEKAKEAYRFAQEIVNFVEEKLT